MRQSKPRRTNPARLIYAMVTQGKACVEYNIFRYESEHREKQLRQLG